MPGCDVLVVGAGPTGLMLALQLARRGIAVQIIDRHAGPARETRALGVQARTLEFYAQLGIVDEALRDGRPAHGVSMWTQGERAAHVEFDDAGADLSPYPFILVLGQDDNERLLGAALNRLGVHVQWQTELIALSQSEKSVSATLRGPDNSTRTIDVPYLAGCDGAHSAVRQLNAIDFEGAPYDHVFYVADVTATGAMTPDEVNVFLWSDGFHLLFPMRGESHWRLVGIVPPELRGRAGLTLDDLTPTIDEQTGRSLKFSQCQWFSTYRIHHRRATRFANGRCFVLGDAAHVHSPVGAQGMNTGLQDACNLAWKLALVCQGRSDPSLLDSYAAERIPVARRLLATTDRAFRFLVADDRAAGFARVRMLPRLLAFAMRRPRIRRLAFRTVSQTGIHYRSSPLSLTLDDVPTSTTRAGDRMPWLQIEGATALLLEAGDAAAPAAGATDLYRWLDDRRFTLVVFGLTISAPVPARLHGLLAAVTVPDSDANRAALGRVGLPMMSFCLVRPDGYLCMLGRHFDMAVVDQHLGRHLGLAGPAVANMTFS